MQEVTWRKSEFYSFKFEAVAKVEAGLYHLALDNLDHIGNRKASAFVALWLATVENHEHILKVSAVHRSAENLIVNASVDFVAALIFRCEFVVHENNSVCVFVFVDLMDFDFHHVKRSFAFVDCILPSYANIINDDSHLHHEVLVNPFYSSFHIAERKVVYPTSYDRVELINAVCKTDAPAPFT